MQQDVELILSVFENLVPDFAGFSLNTEGSKVERATCGVTRETGAVQ
ncbi:hypothetical protein [Paraburkholderia sp. BL23I1N1]|nr:hypothetical protein [Paraburkholderia sp. BL23I1N1]